MRSYKTVREILNQVSAWHHQILDRCCEGDEPDNADPLRPLVDYLAGHERAAKHVLDRFKPEEREAVLNTWLQYVPAEQVDEVFQKRHFDADASADAVTAIILEFDNALVELYRTLANQSQAPPRINEVFQGLLDMEEWQRLRNGFAARQSDTFVTGRG